MFSAHAQATQDFGLRLCCLMFLRFSRWHVFGVRFASSWHPWGHISDFVNALLFQSRPKSALGESRRASDLRGSVKQQKENMISLD